MKFPQVRLLRAVVCSLALVAVFPTHAFAQRVLILVAEDPGSQADLVNDVKGKLDATGRLDQVDVFDAHTATPTLGQLLAYDAVMTWSSDSFHNPNLLGDVLADYVDQGRGVVQTIFSFYVAAPDARLGGRWHSGGYEVFNIGDVLNDNVTLGTYDAGHPLFDGVDNLDTVFGFYQTGVVPASCAQVAGFWSNNEPLVASCAGPSGGRMVALNLYPPSADVIGINWLSTSDGAVLIANALDYAAAAAEPSDTNQAPTANAGADRTIEATGPLGAAFTVTGTATDADGDALTVEWSGAGQSSHQPSLTGTLLPPVGATAVSYTLFFTVNDGQNVATDDVVITVTDTTGPVLANVPVSPLTATATSDAGANVAYGPVTATDAVDGARPVTCSKSGFFPVGDTLVTCSSSDSRGNSSSVSFTVRVGDVTTPGAMAGVGLVRTGGVNYEFEFGAYERGSERARLQVRVTDTQSRRYNRRDDRFYARTADFIAFSDDPTVRPGRSHRPQVDTVLFSGHGDWNGRGGYRYEVFAVDQGDYYHRNDSVRITIKAPNGSVVANVSGHLTSGFVESARLRR
jgi:hypothetical protein